MNIFVASGVTSNLFASLISLRALSDDICIYAAVPRSTSSPARLTALSNFGVKFVTSVTEVPNVKRVLWLSTHDDVEELTKLSKIAPTLAISSGAIMDFLRGKQREDSLNAYQKSKLAVMRIDGVTKFVPGFYLEDVPLPKWASKGLHGDTTQTLFAAIGTGVYQSPEWWAKCYSVTPKSYICAAVTRWILESDAKPATFIVSSDREYRRWELRELAEGYVPEAFRQAAPVKPDMIYKGFDHILRPLSEQSIQMACKRTAALL